MKYPLNEKELYQKAFQLWGCKGQLDCLAEEAAELAVAALHMTRQYKNKTVIEQNQRRLELAEEIADVKLLSKCIEQELNLTNLVEIKFQEKFKRLEMLIKIGAKH